MRKTLVGLLGGLALTFALAACGSSSPRPLNAQEQSTLGTAVGDAAVRCKLGALGSGAGFEDSKMTSDMQAVAVIYKRLGPTAKLSVKSKQTLGQQVRTMIGELTCAPAVSQVLITATGGKAGAAASAARAQAQAAFQKCQTQLQGLMNSEQDLNSHLDIGMNYNDYTTAVGNVRSSYDQTDIHSLGFQCLSVGVHLENAMNDYAKAADTWSTCFNDVNCSNDSIKPQLQAQWSKASDEVQKGKDALQTLQNGGTS